MALRSVTQLIADASRPLGQRSELEVAGGVIEKAINSALFRIVEEYRILAYEEHPPFNFSTSASAGTATATAGNNVVTINSGGLASAIFIGQFLKFSGESQLYHITELSAVGQLRVAPAPATAKTAADCVVIKRFYKLPDGSDGSAFGMDFIRQTGANWNPLFFIISVMDLTNQTLLEAVDIRAIDEQVPSAGAGPLRYARVNDYLYIDPTPDVSTVRLQVRYGRAPAYVSGATTLTPLPEEWEDVVLQSAIGKVLMDENQIARADAHFAFAQTSADRIMKPRDEEMEDHQVVLRPLMARSRRRVRH